MGDAIVEVKVLVINDTRRIGSE